MSQPATAWELPRALQVIRNAQDDLLPSDADLENARKTSISNDLPPIAISSAHAEYFSIFVQLMGAKRILEIGTLGGYSSIAFAKAAPDVHVTSIEFNPKHHQVATENTKHLGNVDIILGAALDVLPELAAKGNIYDFIFIDAAWSEQKQYFDWALKMSHRGSCIFVDNAVRQITESELEHDPSGRALLDHVREEKRVQATLIPWLNLGKSVLDEIVDGFLMAIVK